jgi:tetratricopeptide (TPR) repeat protein
MDMLRTDFGELQLNAKLIDSSKVIEGYIYLSEELAEKKWQEQAKNRRTNILFVLLLASVAFYTWHNGYWISSSQNLESYHPAPALGEVLSDGVVERITSDTAATVKDAQRELGVSIPADIVKFIDADISVEKNAGSSNNVHLEEVNVVAKNTINVEKILASGNELFKRDRLMSPPEHNAFARYEKVLSVQPDHPEALKGIKKIVDRYVYLAEMVIAKKEEYKVPDLIKKAYQAGEKYMDVSVLIQQFSSYLSNDSVFLDLALDESEALTEKANTNNRVDAVQAGNLVEEHGIDVIFSADQKIAEAAYKLYVEGDFSSAEKVLKNFTQLSGFWGESNDLLLKMYLSEAKIAEAENLIYENKALDVYQFAEKAARVMMTRGDNHGALNMLVAYRPEFLENKSYYVLLASLQHKVGDFQRSAYWYRQLLSIDHQDPRLWLGLAVSLDALNQVDDALQAFSYVRLYAQNQSVIKNYINERQLALASY